MVPALEVDVVVNDPKPKKILIFSELFFQLLKVKHTSLRLGRSAKRA